MPDFRYYPRGSVSPDGRVHLANLRAAVQKPWELWTPPFKVAPHVWFVSGFTDVCSYLIDTGDGLVLIDSPFFETLYLQLESIRRAGFDPMDVKHLFISHAHSDHYGGARAFKEYTGAEIWLSREDKADLDRKRAENYTSGPGAVGGFAFDVDRFYNDYESFKMGNMEFTFRMAPGHAAGAVVFRFEDKDEDGTVYKCAMHGGVGATMTTENLKILKYPLEWKQQFIDDCYDMANWDVDICLASHENQLNYLSGVNEDDRNDFSNFVNKNLWRELMISRAENVRGLS